MTPITPSVIYLIPGAAGLSMCSRCPFESKCQDWTPFSTLLPEIHTYLEGKEATSSMSVTERIPEMPNQWIMMTLTECLLCVRHCSKDIIFKISFKPHEILSLFSSMWQMCKLRQRRIRNFMWSTQVYDRTSIWMWAMWPQSPRRHPPQCCSLVIRNCLHQCAPHIHSIWIRGNSGRNAESLTQPQTYCMRICTSNRSPGKFDAQEVWQAVV